jgi:hypothetical protein
MRRETLRFSFAPIDNAKRPGSPGRFVLFCSVNLSSVIASEAKQSRKPRSKDWIASSLALLAMTAESFSSWPE